MTLFDLPVSKAPGIPIACEDCGVTYTVTRRRDYRALQRLCATCKGRKGQRAVQASFVTPESTKAQRLRANAIINRRIKLGWFVPPDRCQKCGSKRNVESHHPDYSRPGEVVWICRRHHVLCHHNLSVIAGLEVMNTDLFRPERVPHAQTPETRAKIGAAVRAARAPNVKGRDRLVRVLSTDPDPSEPGMVIESLICGHRFHRPDDGAVRKQRRCKECGPFRKSRDQRRAA